MFAYGENHAQTKGNVHIRAFYISTGIRGPTSRSKSAQAQEKRHFRQKQRQAHGFKGPNDKLNQAIIRHARQNQHKEPTRNESTKDGPKRPQQGCGRSPGPKQAQLFLAASHNSLNLFRTCIVPPRESNRGSALGEAI